MHDVNENVIESLKGLFLNATLRGPFECSILLQRRVASFFVCVVAIDTLPKVISALS